MKIQHLVKTSRSLLLANVLVILIQPGIGAAATITNLVTNGGFETGDFSGWTLSGNTSNTFVDTEFLLYGL